MSRRITMNWGIKYVICTDISRDGTLSGYAKGLYQELLKNDKLHLIASGGVSCIRDIEELEDLGCSDSIFGKAFYENKITHEEIRVYLRNKVSV